MGQAGDDPTRAAGVFLTDTKRAMPAGKISMIATALVSGSAR